MIIGCKHINLKDCLQNILSKLYNDKYQVKKITALKDNQGFNCDVQYNVNNLSMHTSIFLDDFTIIANIMQTQEKKDMLDFMWLTAVKKQYDKLDINYFEAYGNYKSKKINKLYTTEQINLKLKNQNNIIEM